MKMKRVFLVKSNKYLLSSKKKQNNAATQRRDYEETDYYD